MKFIVIFVLFFCNQVYAIPARPHTALQKQIKSIVEGKTAKSIYFSHFNVNELDENNCYPLHYAAMFGYLHLVELR